MIEEFRKYIEDNKLISHSDKILLAVSGGVDSMVMTHLFINLKIEIGIAHCNFNLRGTESDEDELFVKNFASSVKVPFYCERFDTTGYASKKGISIQMAARELRYRWFEEIRSENNFASVSVAHNLNDNIETFLINLTRGTGITGLTGMKPKHRNLIRPLLFASRTAIMEYMTMNKVPYREDRSNADTKYTRNKIRHSILPVLKEINPSIETTLNETAERLSEINEIISGIINDVRNKVSKLKGSLIVFKAIELNSLTPKRTILFELFKPFGISTGQLDDLISLIDGKTGGQIYTQSHRIIKNRKEILVSLRKNDTTGYFEIKEIDDFRKVPLVISASFADITEQFELPRSPNIACLDAVKISFPLIIRKWRSGDGFYPLGMKEKKKLSDYFIDNKYSIPDKENCLILESEGKIIWIMGDRIDNRFKLTNASKKALIIEVKNLKSDN
jgi:tRNA(Ile)-lysidine synthase